MTRNENNAPLLRVSQLTVRYSGVTAVAGIDFEIGHGEVVAVIGANGAGKSSTLMAISGLAASEGSIKLDGVEISRLSPVERVSKGIVQVPEGRRIFGRLTVHENLEMGAFRRRDRKSLTADFAEIFELFPILRDRKDQKGGTLSGGEQQMLAIGRGLLGNPKLLLLDEPSLGLSPIYTQKIFSIIKELATRGRSILLVEQNANMALKISSRAYCLETGSVSLNGNSAALAQDPRVISAYLGG